MGALTAKTARVKKIACAHDGTCLYVLLKLASGVEAHFRETGATGALGYLYLDTDADARTGQTRDSYGEKLGVECRMWLPTGFHGGSGKSTRPMVAYKVQTYEPGGFEEVNGAVKDSHEAPGFIAFDDPHVEMRVPLKALGVKPPAEVILYMDHMGLAGESKPRRLRIE